MEENIDKLPKWAKQRIETAEQHNVSLKEELRKTIGALTGELPTHVELDPSPGREAQYLPDQSIRFILRDIREGMKWNDHYVDVQIERGRLRVVGGTSIDVLPEAGNVVLVGIRKDRD